MGGGGPTSVIFLERNIKPSELNSNHPQDSAFNLSEFAGPYIYAH